MTIPVVVAPEELSYILHFLTLLSVLYGTSLVLNDGGKNTRNTHSRGDHVTRTSLVRTKEYIKDHQQLRRLNRLGGEHGDQGTSKMH